MELRRERSNDFCGGEGKRRERLRKL